MGTTPRKNATNIPFIKAGEKILAKHINAGIAAHNELVTDQTGGPSITDRPTPFREPIFFPCKITGMDEDGGVYYYSIEEQSIDAQDYSYVTTTNGRGTSGTHNAIEINNKQLEIDSYSIALEVGIDDPGGYPQFIVLATAEAGFWVQVTGWNDTYDGFNWEEQEHDGSGGLQTKDGGRSGSGNTDILVEVNDNFIDVNKYVWVFAVYTDDAENNYYYCQYEGGLWIQVNDVGTYGDRESGLYSDWDQVVPDNEGGFVTLTGGKTGSDTAIVSEVNSFNIPNDHYVYCHDVVDDSGVKYYMVDAGCRCGFWVEITDEPTANADYQSWSEVLDDLSGARTNGLTGDASHILREVNGITNIPNTTNGTPNKDTFVYVYNWFESSGTYYYLFSWEGQGTWASPYAIHDDIDTATPAPDGLSWNIETPPAATDGVLIGRSLVEYVALTGTDVRIFNLTWQETYDSQGNLSEIGYDDLFWIDVSTAAGICCCVSC